MIPNTDTTVYNPIRSYTNNTDSDSDSDPASNSNSVSNDDSDNHPYRKRENGGRPDPDLNIMDSVKTANNLVPLSYVSTMYDKYKFNTDKKITIGIINYYMDAYESSTGHDHPPIKESALYNIIKSLDDGSCIAEADVDIYAAIIDKHFETKYQANCDYSIIHFFNGEIRNNRYHEILRE